MFLGIRDIRHEKSAPIPVNFKKWVVFAAKDKATGRRVGPTLAAGAATSPPVAHSRPVALYLLRRIIHIF